MYKRMCVLLLGLALMLISCSEFPAQDIQTKRNCPIETLILDEKLLPENTFAEKLHSPSTDEPSESASRSFYYAPDSIYHLVVRYDLPKLAKERFVRWSKSAFDVDEHMGPWEVPSGVNSVSVSADEYQIGCGIAHNVYQCRMIATYDEYFVYFKADVSEKGITLHTVEELVRAIDDRMTECTEDE